MDEKKKNNIVKFETEDDKFIRELGEEIDRYVSKGIYVVNKDNMERLNDIYCLVQQIDASCDPLDVKINLSQEYGCGEVIVEAPIFDVVVSQMYLWREACNRCDCFGITPLENGNIRINMEVKKVFNRRLPGDGKGKR